MNIYLIVIFVPFVPFVDFVVIFQSNQADFAEGLVFQDPVRSEY